MRRHGEEDARLAQHQITVCVRRNGSELQRHEPVVLEVECLYQTPLSAFAHDLERLVAVTYELGHVHRLILAPSARLCETGRRRNRRGAPMSRFQKRTRRTVSDCCSPLSYATRGAAHDRPCGRGTRCTGGAPPWAVGCQRERQDGGNECARADRAGQHQEQIGPVIDKHAHRGQCLHSWLVRLMPGPFQWRSPLRPEVGGG